ncbi:MAG: hypothetical protein ACI8XV_001915 [Arenicella sp.]
MSAKNHNDLGEAMNILQEILQAQDGRVVEKLASQLGLDAERAQKALSNLIPAVAGGIKKTAQSTGIDLGPLKKILPLAAGLVMSSLNMHGESNDGRSGELLGSLCGAPSAVQPRDGGLGGLLSSLFGKKTTVCSKQKKLRISAGFLRRRQYCRRCHEFGQKKF